MTTNLAKPDDKLSAEEADRLASRIRPSWEVDDDDDMPPPGFATQKTQESAPLPEAGATGPHDTVVDGGGAAGASATRMGLGSSEAESAAEGPAIVSSKIVSIGDPTPEEAPKPIAAAPVAAAPVGAAPIAHTKTGGLEPAEIEAEEAAPEVPPSKKAPPARKPNKSRAPNDSDDARPSTNREAPVLAPVEPIQPSFSKADDPIEIPVQKTSKTMMLVIGGAVALAAVVGIVMVAGGDKKPDTAPTATATSAPAATTKPEAPKPAETAPATTTQPAETAAATSAPSSAATAAATEAPAATSTPTSTPAATSKPVAAATPDPPKTKPSSGSKPSGSSGSSGSSGGSTKKPPKGGSGSGGIIRDAPF